VWTFPGVRNKLAPGSDRQKISFLSPGGFPPKSSALRVCILAGGNPVFRRIKGAPVCPPRIAAGGYPKTPVPPHRGHSGAPKIESPSSPCRATEFNSARFPPSWPRFSPQKEPELKTPGRFSSSPLPGSQRAQAWKLSPFNLVRLENIPPKDPGNLPLGNFAQVVSILPFQKAGKNSFPDGDLAPKVILTAPGHRWTRLGI